MAESKPVLQNCQAQESATLGDSCWMLRMPAEWPVRAKYLNRPPRTLAVPGQSVTYMRDLSLVAVACLWAWTDLALKSSDDRSLASQNHGLRVVVDRCFRVAIQHAGCARSLFRSSQVNCCDFGMCTACPDQMRAEW